VMGVSAGSVLV